jgi:hypothetical protein
MPTSSSWKTIPCHALGCNFLSNCDLWNASSHCPKVWAMYLLIVLVIRSNIHSRSFSRLVRNVISEAITFLACLFLQLRLFLPQIPVELHRQPHLRRCLKIGSESKSHFWAHSPLASADLVDDRMCRSKPPRYLALRKLHGLKIFLFEDFTWMDRVPNARGWIFRGELLINGSHKSRRHEHPSLPIGRRCDVDGRFAKQLIIPALVYIAKSYCWILLASSD